MWDVDRVCVGVRVCRWGRRRESRKLGGWATTPRHATPRHATHAIRLKQRRFRQLYTQVGSRTEGSGNRDRKRQKQQRTSCFAPSAPDLERTTNLLIHSASDLCPLSLALVFVVIPLVVEVALVLLVVVVVVVVVVCWEDAADSPFPISTEADAPCACAREFKFGFASESTITTPELAESDVGPPSKGCTELFP